MRRILVVVIGISLFALACGDDDDSASDVTGGTSTTTTVDVEAFCAALAEVAALELAAGPVSDALSTIMAAAEAAPSSSLAGGLDAIAEYGKELNESEPFDQPRSAQLNEAAYDPVLIEAADDLRDYADDECGLREIAVFEQFADNEGFDATRNIDIHNLIVEVTPGHPELAAQSLRVIDVSGTVTLLVLDSTDAASAVEFCSVIGEKIYALGAAGVPVAVDNEQAVRLAVGESGDTCVPVSAS